MIDKSTKEYIIEKSLADLCIKIAEITDGNTGEEAFYSFAKNRYGSWHNKVFHLNIPQEVVKDRVEELISNMKQDRIPKNLLINSRTTSDALTEFLIKNNFSIFHEQTGMYINTNCFNYKQQDTSENIRLIENETYVEEWVAAAGAAFGKSNNPELFKTIVKEKDFKLYAYFIDKEIAATAMSYVCDGVVGIHMVGTLEKFRGRGLATDITNRIVADSKNAGYKLCALQASKMGKSVYEKIGFEEDSKIVHWKLDI